MVRTSSLQRQRRRRWSITSPGLCSSLPESSSRRLQLIGLCDREVPRPSGGCRARAGPGVWSTQIELAWTVIPILIVSSVLATARVIHAVRMPQNRGRVEVTVIGHQFWWEFRYPALGIVTANELHIPVSDRHHAHILEPAFRRHRPQFLGSSARGKDRPDSESHEQNVAGPAATGIFLGQCAQYCGTQHAKMLLRVSVDSPEDFDAWVQAQKQSANQDREREPAGVSLKQPRA